MTTPIGAVGTVPFTVPTAGASAAAPTSSANGTSFGHAISHGLDALAGAQSTADGLAVQAATGSLADISQYTVAAGKAQVMTEFAAAMRTKAVDAFNTVMGMQA